MRWVGFVRVAGIFVSRRPQTCGTCGSGLVKVPVRYFDSLDFFLDIIE